MPRWSTRSRCRVRSSRARSTSTRCSTRPRVPRAARPVSRYPASAIDLAFVVSDDVPAGEVLRTLRGSRRRPARSGASASTSSAPTRSARGRVSLAFALQFRAPDRTLTDAEVGALRQQCIDAVVDGVRGRAARMSAERRSRIGSGSGTPRSTARASCSTRTGSPTSTRRAPASWSRGDSAATTGSRVRRDAREGRARVVGAGALRRVDRRRRRAGTDRHEVVRCAVPGVGRGPRRV